MRAKFNLIFFIANQVPLWIKKGVAYTWGILRIEKLQSADNLFIRLSQLPIWSQAAPTIISATNHNCLPTVVWLPIVALWRHLKLPYTKFCPNCNSHFRTTNLTILSTTSSIKRVSQVNKHSLGDDERLSIFFQNPP